MNDLLLDLQIKVLKEDPNCSILDFKIANEMLLDQYLNEMEEELTKGNNAQNKE